MIHEKFSTLKSMLPMNFNKLHQNLQSFHQFINERIENLLPNGIPQINLITIYMTQKNIEINSSLGNEKPSAFISVANIQQELYNLSISLKQENKIAICNNMAKLLSDYNYKLNIATPLSDLVIEDGSSL